MKVLSGTLTKGSEEAAGFDIHCSESFSIPAGKSKAVNTNLKVAIPTGWVGIVKARSGLSFNGDIEVGAGVIDSDYRGEVKVKLYNNSNALSTFEEGTRIAQMVVAPHYTGELEYVDTLDQTERGEGGFGSSGEKAKPKKRRVVKKKKEEVVVDNEE